MESEVSGKKETLMNLGMLINWGQSPVDKDRTLTLSNQKNKILLYPVAMRSERVSTRHILKTKCI